MSELMSDIVLDGELNLQKKTEPGDESPDALMVVSSKLLPTQMVVAIPRLADHAAWKEKVVHVAKSVLPKTGRVRVFLPDDWSEEGELFGSGGSISFEVVGAERWS